MRVKLLYLVFFFSSIALSNTKESIYLLCADAQNANTWHWANEGTYKVFGAWQAYWYKHNVYLGFKITADDYIKARNQCPRGGFVQPAINYLSDWIAFVIEALDDQLLLAPGYLTATQKNTFFALPSSQFKPYFTCEKNGTFTSKRLAKNCVSKLINHSDYRIRFGR